MKRVMFLILIILVSKPVLACSIAGDGKEHQVGKEIVQFSDLILHVVALDYVKLPRYDPRKDSFFTNASADSTVRFRVVEVVKGKYEPKEIVLSGFLGNSDYWNDSKTVPYNFVRPSGRSGSCFANTYRQGGEFLFMLKKTKTGEYTQFWYVLAPTEEQIHPRNDSWLQWVKNEVKR